MLGRQKPTACRVSKVSYVWSDGVKVEVTGAGGGGTQPTQPKVSISKELIAASLAGAAVAGYVLYRIKKG